jgi:hypothetical protein
MTRFKDAVVAVYPSSVKERLRISGEMALVDAMRLI